MLILRSTKEPLVLNDLYVLGRIGRDLAVMMVEGKVDESFGPLLEEWLRGASDGKHRAFARLMGVEGGKGRLERVPRHVGVELWMGWVTG